MHCKTNGRIPNHKKISTYTHTLLSVSVSVDSSLNPVGQSLVQDQLGVLFPLECDKKVWPKTEEIVGKLEKSSKKQVSKTKRSRGKTGGGKNKYEISSVSAKVVSIVPAQLASISNPYDDDAVTSEEEAGRKSIQESSKTLEREVISSILAGNRSDIGQVSNISGRISPQELCTGGLKKVVAPRLHKRRLLAGQELIIEMEEQAHEKKFNKKLTIISLTVM
ncbi:hypothetical protein Fcan01_12845 [Folsomia candida]|uniref:Uncharacterized protein n=1 Tax=Folsomia candida TaxID=158441 RepID=A0A226E5Q2_FOLCA|nr:hypothetical protein Fcan01_12845 [Folsomia candida]